LIYAHELRIFQHVESQSQSNSGTDMPFTAFDVVTRLKSTYEKIERFNPFVFFFGGFTWDSLTLRRIDQLLDNAILLTYLLLLGVLTVAIIMAQHGKIRHPLFLKYEKWFPLGLQFLLGGLFSAYVIFYFQSASFTKTSLFLLILVALLAANEFLEKRLANLHFLLGVYFLASFSFFIFFIPVVVRTMNLVTFLAGGMLSLSLLGGMLWFLYKKQALPARASYARAGALIIGLYAVLNLFYWANIIPPVPLSLKWGGIYHHAARRTDGNYELRMEHPAWYQFWKQSDKTFHYARGDTVSCFTSVFAPTLLKKKIFHHWQKYAGEDRGWVSTDRLGFEITGYRDGGYRGITRKQHVSEGKWRVDIETREGHILGRINFEIRERDKPIELKTIYR